MTRRPADVFDPHIILPHLSPPGPATRRASNFDTLLRAVRTGALCLMDCEDARTGAPRYVLCAVCREGEAYLFTPFGHLAEGNPYEA